MPAQSPRACISWPLCPSLSPRKTYPNRCKTTVLRMLPLVGGEPLRMAVGGRSPHSRHVERGLLRALAAQGVPRCWVRLAWVCCRRAGLDFAGWGLSHGGRDPAAPGFSLACASSSAPTGSSLRIQEGSGSRYVMPARTRRPQGNLVGVSFFHLLT